MTLIAAQEVIDQLVLDMNPGSVDVAYEIHETVLHSPRRLSSNERDVEQYRSYIVVRKERGEKSEIGSLYFDETGALSSVLVKHSVPFGQVPSILRRNAS